MKRPGTRNGSLRRLSALALGLFQSLDLGASAHFSVQWGPCHLQPQQPAPCQGLLMEGLRSPGKCRQAVISGRTIDHTQSPTKSTKPGSPGSGFLVSSEARRYILCSKAQQTNKTRDHVARLRPAPEVLGPSEVPVRHGDSD